MKDTINQDEQIIDQLSKPENTREDKTPKPLTEKQDYGTNPRKEEEKDRNDKVSKLSCGRTVYSHELKPRGYLKPTYVEDAYMCVCNESNDDD